MKTLVQNKSLVQNNSNAPSKFVKPIVLIRLGFAQFLLHWTYCKIQYGVKFCIKSHCNMIPYKHYKHIPKISYIALT